MDYNYMDYNEFRVIIKNRNSIVIKTPTGVPIPIDIEIDHLTERTVDILRKWIRKDVFSDPEEFRVLGIHLFNMIFNKTAKSIFADAYKNFQNQDKQGLRVVLEFEPDARDLAHYPWEYIYYHNSEEGKGFFIATEDRLVLTRHVPIKVKNLQKRPRPLRILIISCKPKRTADGGELGIVKDRDIIKAIEMLKEKQGGALEIEVLINPNKKSLQEYLSNQSNQIHVVHFIGHGHNMDNGSGYLGLVSKENEDIVAWIKDEDFADCFPNPKPRLIFLHACEGACSSSYNAFRGVALQLAYDRVPAIVAMQFEINNEKANHFAETFYRSLGMGKDIDVAVQDGRKVLGEGGDIKNYCCKDFGTPVVFMQSSDGIIIAEPNTNITGALNNCLDEKEEPQDCPNVKYKLCNGGKILRRDVACDKCGLLVAHCPNNHVFSRESGICSGCGYNAREAAKASAVSSANSGISPTEVTTLNAPAAVKAPELSTDIDTKIR